jgi:DnaJ like chaperone protein
MGEGMSLKERLLSLRPLRALRSTISGLRLRWRRGRRPAHQNAAFTSAFVALAAKMAKADGVAVRVEKEAFERFLETPPGEILNVRRLYDLAKEDAAGYETYAERIGNLLRDESGLKRSVLECLIYIACADGVLHPEEDAFLATVAGKFGYSPAEYRRIRALFVRDSESPYEILGLPPDTPGPAIKTHYRRLVSEIHPDRLAAAGAEPAIVKAATAKLATINAAYEAILAERARGGRT